MTKTGQITQITPDGGYQSQRGYIYTFQMTIQCPDGTFTGQIGSKSQVYPLGIGETINVDVTSTQHGVRFKKFNPQYAQQQIASAQAAIGRPADSQTAKQSESKVDMPKIRSMAISYAKDMFVADKADGGTQFWRTVCDMTAFIVAGVTPKPNSNIQTGQQKMHTGDDKPFSPEEPDDEIPWENG